jgi:hypothetical protein
MGDENGIDPLDDIRRDGSSVPADVEDPVAQDRVGQEAYATDLQKDRGMADERQVLG